MTNPRFKRLDAQIAYPWPVDAEMPDDITGMDMSETIYGPGASMDGVLGGFVLGWNELGDEL